MFSNHHQETMHTLTTQMRDTGWVYFVLNESTDLVKIGYSCQPSVRLKQLQHEYKPAALRPLGVVPGSFGKEKGLHTRFARLQWDNDEWYVHDEEIAQFLREHAMLDFKAELTTDELDERTRKNEAKLERVKKKLRSMRIGSYPKPEPYLRDLVTLREEDCREYLTYNNYRYQRDLSESFTLEYAAKMLDGRFHSIDLVIAEHNGERLLMNSQTSLHAVIAAASVDPDVSIMATKFVYDCPTDEGLACLWAQFDVGRGRTAKQVAAGYVPVLGEGWTSDSVTRMALACSISRGGVGYRSHAEKLSKDDRVLLIRNYMPQVVIARDLIFPRGGGPPINHLDRGLIGHVMIDSLKDDEAKAIEFWTMVGSGLGFGPEDQNHPAYRLRSYLLAVVNNRKKNKREKKEEDADTIARCVNAFKAYCSGRTLTVLRGRVGKAGIPEL